jgi:hypothetical protein
MHYKYSYSYGMIFKKLIIKVQFVIYREKITFLFKNIRSIIPKFVLYLFLDGQRFSFLLFFSFVLFIMNMYYFSSKKKPIYQDSIITIASYLHFITLPYNWLFCKDKISFHLGKCFEKVTFQSMITDFGLLNVTEG